MNYNHNYATSQSPNNGGYSGDSPAYSASGRPNHGFPQGAGQSAQTTHVHGQPPYAPYAHQNAYMNGPYQHINAGYHQSSSPAYAAHPMVVIPQRSPVQASPPSMSAPPTFQHQTQLYQQHSSPLLQHPAQPQAVWQNYNDYQQQAQAQFADYGQYTSPHPPSTIQSAPQSRLVTSKPQAMVEIPMQQPPPHQQWLPSQSQAHPHPKLQPPPQRPSSHTAVQTSSSSSPRLPNVAAAKKAAASPAPSADYQQLLLLLAEDYIDAAHGMGSLVAFYRREEDLKQYYTLMATGLSCVEASLTQFRLAPQAEAQLVLQYCNLVFKETENYDEVDKWLSKTIPLCDRNKLLDLKYGMHHLSARALFTTRPRAALKFLDSLIPSAQAYKHVPWVYALRFLRVSFSFKSGVSNQELAAAVQNLKAISQLAAGDDDGAVLLVSATYEALLHLRSMNASCVEDAQRAVAAAKSLQFHPLAKSLGQVWALLDCVEVICCLMEGNPAMAAQKAEQMAPMMDEIRANPKADDDGVLQVPLQGQPSSLTENTCGIFRRIGDKDHLVFQWLPRRDLWAFCFLLNAIAAQTRTFADQKAEAYIREGLKIMKENLSDSSLSREDVLPKSSSLNATVQRLDWWFNLRWCLQIYMTINACSRAEWLPAREYLIEALSCPAVTSVNSATSRARWETFLQATILQGSGQTEEALSMYQSEVLQLPAGTTHKAQGLETDLSILAVLNSVLISMDPSHPNHSDASILHKLVSPLIVNHPNISLRAAHDLLRCVLNPHDKLIDKKKHFHNCLAAARIVNNTQLVSIALSLMCTMFFKNVIGEQAQKSVNSARALADRSRSTLWRSVATGLQEQTALRHGNEKDALAAVRDGESFVDGLPHAIKSLFMVDQ